VFVRPKVAGAYRKTNTGGAREAPGRQLIAVAEDGGERSQPACWDPERRVENDAPSYGPITLPLMMPTESLPRRRHLRLQQVDQRLGSRQRAVPLEQVLSLEGVELQVLCNSVDELFVRERGRG